MVWICIGLKRQRVRKNRKVKIQRTNIGTYFVGEFFCEIL